MSAFLVSTNHVHYLVAAGVALGAIPRTDANADLAGSLLLAANLASLGARYGPEAALSDARDAGIDEAPYVFAAPARPVELVQTIKAAHCLAYQACEYDGWETSDAKRLLDAIEAAALALLPARLRELVKDRYSDRQVPRVFQSDEYGRAAWGVPSDAIVAQGVSS